VASLTTLKAVKAKLEATQPDDARDALISDCITRVSRWFEGQTHRVLGQTAHQITVDGNGRSRMYLPQYPVLDTGLTVTVDGADIPKRTVVGGSGWVLADKDSALARIELVGYVFSKDVQNVDLAFTAGYAPDALPGDLERAVIQMVILDFKEGPRLGIQSESQLGTSVSFLPSVVPSAVQSVVDEYTRPM
jgi:hypothetical protein